jgi:hypothetical protein
MLPIDKFIEDVKNERFVRAHEMLEESWKELKKVSKDEANLQKGLINGTTAIALKLKGKEKGAYMVWETYMKYKPLINTVASDLSEKYKTAAKLLDEKYQIYMA